MRFAWIEEHSREFPVAVMCRVLNVSESGYFSWLQREPSESGARRAEILTEINRLHLSDRSLGSPRIYQALLTRGLKTSRNTVAKIMRDNDLRAQAPRRFVPQTTDSNHKFPVAENILNREFSANGPNQKWAADITYVHTREGWLFVAAVIDLYSRKIVGWSMAGHMRTELVSDAFTMALTRRKPPPGLIHHSDRGSQYASGEYRKLIADHGCVCSMSRAGNCYDNAVMESFWCTLKKELVYQHEYATREEARRSIFAWIECHYNRVRMHSSLGYVSPELFEAAS